MKVAIGTFLFTERDMYVNASHNAKIPQIQRAVKKWDKILICDRFP